MKLIGNLREFRLPCYQIARLRFLDDVTGVWLHFIADFAHNLLHQVLDGDEPGDGPVFVDDDGELGGRLLQLLQQVGGALGFRHEGDRLDERPEGDGRLLLGRQLGKIRHADDSFDAVELAGIDGVARMAFLAEQRAQFLHRRVNLDGVDLRPRRHDFPHHLVAELDDRLEQLPFGLLEDS